jgi:Flp pilus assembly pilin Flp
MSAARASARRGERGATALEFGLVSSLVLTVMLGIIQYGYHLWALETAEAVAREAARRLAVGTGWSCVQAEMVERADFPAVVTPPPPPAPEYEDGSPTPQVGKTVSVTIRFQTLDLGLFPGVHDVVEGTSRTRVEHVAAGDTSYLCD